METISTFSPALQQALFQNGLFAGLAEQDKKDILLRLPQPRQAQKNEVLYSPTQFEKALVFFLEGTAAVTRVGDDKPVLLRRLSAGDVVGAAALYSNEDTYVSEITATSPCVVLLLPAALWSELMQQYFILAENYIRFLTGRIRFLNGRIAYYTDGSADNRLLHYLENQRLADGRLELPSFIEISRTLHMGRSSLYRSLDALEQQGVLQKRDKVWYMKER